MNASQAKTAKRIKRIYANTGARFKLFTEEDLAGVTFRVIVSVNSYEINFLISKDGTVLGVKEN